MPNEFKLYHCYDCEEDFDEPVYILMGDADAVEVCPCCGSEDICFNDEDDWLYEDEENDD